jgi:hypothetical protein
MGGCLQEGLMVSVPLLLKSKLTAQAVREN